MSKSTTTCDVYCKLPFGVIIGEESYGLGMAMDGPHSERLVLQHGVTEGVSRRRIEAWLAKNKNLSAVKRGDVRIISEDVLAYDSGK